MPSLSSPQRCHGSTADTLSDWTDSLLAGCCLSLMSHHQDLPHRTVLPEAARGKQREQGNPHPGSVRVHLSHVDGNPPVSVVCMALCAAGLSEACDDSTFSPEKWLKHSS